MCKISIRLDKNCFIYAASRFEKHGFEKRNVIATILKKKNYQKNFLLSKILKEAPNFQLATVVLFLVITIQYSNIVTFVTRNRDESLNQSLGKIVRKSMGSDPMRDSFLALRDSFRDSGRHWFPILFFLHGKVFFYRIRGPVNNINISNMVAVSLLQV